MNARTFRMPPASIFQAPPCRQLEGRTAIATGAGSGIGRAVALLFARERASVVAADLSLEASGETVLHPNSAGEDRFAGAKRKETKMRIGFVFAGTALIAFLPAFHVSAQAFEGPYAGVHVGGQQTDVRNLRTELGAQTPDADRQFFTGRLFAGYDRQVAPWVVLGAEAGVDLAADDALEASTATGLVAIDPRWSLDLTARAGYLLDPTTLAYVRGGYANARIETSANTPLLQLSEIEFRDRWTLGAGIERQILKRISGRLEYLYSGLSEGNGTFDRHRLLAGFAYRF